jgi:predicted flap endonuclease-1-like 5' DNA nuclease
VWLSYNDPEYLKKRYGLTDDQIKTIIGIGPLIEQALN